MGAPENIPEIFKNPRRLRTLSCAAYRVEASAASFLLERVEQLALVGCTVRAPCAGSSCSASCAASSTSRPFQVIGLAVLFEVSRIRSRGTIVIFFFFGFSEAGSEGGHLSWALRTFF